MTSRQSIFASARVSGVHPAVPRFAASARVSVDEQGAH
jgi:hypothetical protein